MMLEAAVTSVPGNEIATLPTLYRKINLAVMVNFTFSEVCELLYDLFILSLSLPHIPTYLIR